MPPVPRTPTEQYWPHSPNAFNAQIVRSAEVNRDFTDAWIDENLYGEFPGTPAPVSPPPPGPTATAFVEYYDDRDSWDPPYSLTDAGAIPMMQQARARQAAAFFFGSMGGDAGQLVPIRVWPAFETVEPGIMATRALAEAEQIPAERPIWPWVLGGVGVLGLLGVLIYAARRKRRRNPRSRRRHASRRARRRRSRMSPAARRFVSSDIRRLRRRGYGRKQAVAVAYAQARRKGYRVPAL